MHNPKKKKIFQGGLFSQVTCKFAVHIHNIGIQVTSTCKLVPSILSLNWLHTHTLIQARQQYQLTVMFFIKLPRAAVAVGLATQQSGQINKITNIKQLLHSV